ncbi:putative leader peptide [Candidatus Frankia nodulisporulans]|uniref:putative leader peptide n=1 Tax=Candidatus Frankia nodulisporulans TaxID=2060052 RepID=UPI00370484D2
MVARALTLGAPVVRRAGRSVAIACRRGVVSSPAAPCLVIEPMLVARLYVDLLRVSSAGCRRSR